jgi:hypothetical protein
MHIYKYVCVCVCVCVSMYIYIYISILEEHLEWNAGANVGVSMHTLTHAAYISVCILKPECGCEYVRDTTGSQGLSNVYKYMYVCVCVSLSLSFSLSLSLCVCVGVLHIYIRLLDTRRQAGHCPALVC